MKLPLNCTVDYIPDFLSNEETEELYTLLINQYQIDKARLTIQAAGQLIKTDSFKILFLTEALKKLNTHPEEVHGKAYLWTGKMAELKTKVENYLQKEFELAMCLYYPDGNYFAGYHSDLQTSGYHTILPSLSLGEVREFSFKNKESGDCYNLDLASGSMLVMGAYCQSRYTHSLLKNPKYKGGRINITFRERNFQ